MKVFKISSLFSATVAIIAIAACNKNTYDAVIPPAQVHFTNKAEATYYVQNKTNDVYNVTVGVTATSDQDRTINYTVTSPTNASNTQYSIANVGKVTIPAGQTTAVIPVKGSYSGYPTSSRVDTLIFRLNQAEGVDTTIYNNTFKLAIKKYCDVDLNSLLGDYNNTRNSAAGAPYKTTVTSVTSTGPTSGYMIVTGIFNGTSSAIRVNLDWSNPANFTTTVVETTGIYIDASLNAQGVPNNYGPVSVRPSGSGTFSSCDNTFTLSYQRYVAAGNFTANTTIMAR